MALWATKDERWAAARLLANAVKSEDEAGRDPAAPIAQMYAAIEAATTPLQDEVIKATMEENLATGIVELGPPFPQEDE